jgi:hypothetical protein
MDTFSPFEKVIVGILHDDVERTTSAERHPSLDALLDCAVGALPPRERALVEVHALRCPHCRERMESLAVGVEGKLRDLFGQTPSWSFAAWLAQRERRTREVRRPFWRSANVVWALGGAAAAICLGVATWDMLKPEDRWVARGEVAGGIPTLALALFAAAGVLMSIVVLVLILRGKKR